MKHIHRIRMMTIVVLAVVLLGSSYLASTTLAQDPHFTSIDFPGAAVTVANAVNVNGDIVGFYRLPNSTGGLQAPKGFMLSNGVFTTITVPNASRTRVEGINDNGDIVGDYLQSGVNYGFLRLAGTTSFQSIRYSNGTFQSSNTDSWGIDNDGNVTGGYTNSAGSTVAYIWRDGSFTRTFEAGFPNSGVAGAIVSYTHGIKPNGEIVGCYFVGTGNTAEMHGLPEHAHAAAIDAIQARQDLSQRALAGAVLAAQRVARSGGDVERHALQRAHAGEPLADPVEAQDRVRARLVVVHGRGYFSLR